MASWLYPISKRGKKHFDLKRGVKLEVSAENFEELARDNRLDEDEHWYLSANHGKVRPGDEVYIYTGDDDKGIIGYAIVKKVRREEPSLKLSFDKTKCLGLVEEPVPASLIRKWVYPRRAVVDLTPFQLKLRSLLPWRPEHPRKTSEQLVVQTRGAGFGDPRLNKRIEKAAVRAVTAIYRRKGWVVESVERDKLGFDLLCSKSSRVQKVEVKGVRADGVSFMMTAGERRRAKDRDFILQVVCAALSKKPSIRAWSGQQLEKAFSFDEVQYRVSLKNQ